MISLDSETTGIDLYHGAKPFFVTSCADDGEQRWWEWDVDPFTREPQVPDADIREISRLIRDADRYVLQNAKFDYAALRALDERLVEFWDWDKVDDTLILGHLLATNQPHDLTSMTVQYLGTDIEPYELHLKEVTMGARRLAQSKSFKERHPGWRLAEKGLADMPSAKEKVWKLDSWLPRALAKKLHYDDGHDWWTALSLYGNADSAATIMLLKAMLKEADRRGLRKIYEARMKMLRLASEMETRGVTMSRARLDALTQKYTQEGEASGASCVNVAKGHKYDLTLPKSGNNGSLRRFVFDVLKLQPMGFSEQSGEPSLNKEALEKWSVLMDRGSSAQTFLNALVRKRKMDTSVSYMAGYKRFWLPVNGHGEWHVLHPNLNPTGTGTTRWSHNNPNSANVSKKEDANLRYCFGPMPDREYWSMDGRNMELRVPAYEAQEEDFINLFEHPDDPPYYGSNHLLVFDLLYPREFAKHGKDCKKVYAATLYDRIKRGNFAIQYDAGDATADKAYGVPGARAKIKARFSKQEELSRHYRSFADKYGYVETLPDKSVDPERGFPILCTRTEFGRVKSTVPFSYHIQGTVGWWMMRGMTRCAEYLRDLNDGRDDKDRCYMILQIHDELVFDFPRRVKTNSDGRVIYGNLPMVRRLKQLMEQGGDDIGVPTPVSVEYHAESYAEGLTVNID